jgi:hypothetical protein
MISEGPFSKGKMLNKLKKSSLNEQLVKQSAFHIGTSNKHMQQP